MRVKSIQFRSLTFIGLMLAVALVSSQLASFAQTGNPLVDDRPVTIVRKPKTNRKPKKPIKKATVVSAPLLKLQWRVLKVKENGDGEETSPLALFHAGDRLRLAVKANQDGFLYIIHQASPRDPGQIIFPDSRVNGGRNDVGKQVEIMLPSNCPAGMLMKDCSLPVTGSAGQEVFTLVFTRDPFTDLPNTAAESTGGIPVETLLKLRSGSGQTLKRMKGSTPMSVLVINTNTKDNEDIFETLLLNKGQ